MVSRLRSLVRRWCSKKSEVMEENEIHVTDTFVRRDSLNLNQFEVLTKGITSMTTQAERRVLLYLSLACPADGDIVEVGSWVGGTTCFLARGCQMRGTGIVNAIDHFEGKPGAEHVYSAGLNPGESIYDRFVKNIQLAGVEKYIRIWKMHSDQARNEINDPCSLVFIDGNHQYEYVRDDILRWGALVKPGGFLVLHDFHKAGSGVVRATEEEVICRKDWHRFLLVHSLFIAQRR